MEWISVKDALPKVNHWSDRINCVVVWKGHSYGGGCYQNVTGKDEDGIWSISHIHSSESLEVTHWILIPEPPKQP